jgi:hypothetical protein
MFGGAGIKSEWDAMMGAQQKTLENCFAHCSIWDLSPFQFSRHSTKVQI